VTAGGLEERHRGRAAAPAAVGAGRPHPARALQGHPLAAGRRVPAAVLPPATCAYAGNVRRFGPPHTRVVHYSIQGSFRGLKMSLQEQTRRASRREPIMNRTSRLAATVLVSGVLGLAGLGLAAGTAQAAPRGPYQWCPGQPLPATDVNWDMSVCHTWYRVDSGFQANVGSFVYEGDRPPANLGCAPIRCLPGI
jgi:hypothetical protein